MRLLNSAPAAVPLIANFLLFQTVWLVTVIAASRDLTWPGIAAVGFFLVAHAALSESARGDYLLCAMLVAVGIVVEAIFGGSGLIVHRDAFGGGLLPPVWMLVLWCNLALVLNNSVAWVQGKHLLAALFGGVGGALSYLGGIALGAAEFGTSTPSALMIVGATWAVLTPLLFLAAERVHQRQRL
jgi:hypothetical protein